MGLGVQFEQNKGYLPIFPTLLPSFSYQCPYITFSPITRPLHRSGEACDGSDGSNCGGNVVGRSSSGRLNWRPSGRGRRTGLFTDGVG